MKSSAIFFILLVAVGLTGSRAQDRWTQMAEFGGTGRHLAVGFSIGDKGYVGTGNSGALNKDFWEYDPASDGWAQKADFGGSEIEGAVGFSILDKGTVGTGMM